MTEDKDITDVTKLELWVTPRHIAYMAHTSCRSFVKEQPGRFRTDAGSSAKNEHLMGSGWLHWPEKDLYLYALIMQQYFIARGYQSSVLIDEHVEEWVVWTNDPLDMEEKND